MPDILPADEIHALLMRWLEGDTALLQGRATMYELSVSSRTREVAFNVLIPGADGSAETAGEGDAAFCIRVQTSFAEAVNDELEAMGLPRFYTALVKAGKEGH